MSDTLVQIQTALYEGGSKSVAGFVQKALDEGEKAGQVLKQGLLAGMERVGRDFKANILYVPEVLLAARAMHAGMDVLKPFLTAGDTVRAGRLLIGTVRGDLHDIGKNLVGMMMEGTGFEVVDIGIDVPPVKFVEAVRTYQPDLVGLCALLTTTMPEMKTVIDALTEAGLRGKVKVMVGGAPVTEAYARSIDADGYAPDAMSAVDKARELMRSRREEARG
jgi:5-methyltetrahydrofolate--homocysteine methyltransferase